MGAIPPRGARHDLPQLSAALAAPLDALPAPETVDEVLIPDPPTSHRDGPHLLGVMRVLAVPAAVALLAPGVGLSLAGERARDRAFDLAAAAYRLAGAEGKLRRE